MSQKIFSGRGSVNIQIGNINFSQKSNIKNINFNIGEKEKLIYEKARKVVARKNIFEVLNFFSNAYLEKKFSHCHLVFFDINDFTQINNTHSLEIGNQVASIVYNTLIKKFPGYMFARIGPDEFIGVCYDLEDRNLLNIIEKINSDIKNYYWGDEINTDVFVSVSAGIADLSDSSFIINDKHRDYCLGQDRNFLLKESG